MKLDLDTRARRATSRKNNKTRRDLPLLDATGTIPDEWITDEDEQRQRLYRLDVAWYWKHRDLKRLGVWNASLAGRWREAAKRFYTPEEMAELDKRRTILPRDPVYAAGFWRQRLREAGGYKYEPLYSLTEIKEQSD